MEVEILQYGLAIHAHSPEVFFLLRKLSVSSYLTAFKVESHFIAVRTLKLDGILHQNEGNLCELRRFYGIKAIDSCQKRIILVFIYYMSVQIINHIDKELLFRVINGFDDELAVM